MNSRMDLRVPIARAWPPLAVLYAAGAYWLAQSFALAALAAASVVVRLPVSALYRPGVALIASCAAFAIALRSGGWISVLLFAVSGAIYAALLDRRPACEEISSCLDVLLFARAHLAEVIGALVGVVLAMGLRRRDGVSTLLLAAGIIGLAVPLIRAIFAPLPPVIGAAAYERFLLGIGAQAAAALAAGVVLGSLAGRAGPGLAVVGLAFVLPWLGGPFRQWWQDLQELQAFGFEMTVPTIIQTQWQTFLPVGYATLMLAGFLGARVVRAIAARHTELRPEG